MNTHYIKETGEKISVDGEKGSVFFKTILIVLCSVLLFCSGCQNEVIEPGTVLDMEESADINASGTTLDMEENIDADEPGTVLDTEETTDITEPSTSLKEEAEPETELNIAEKEEKVPESLKEEIKPWLLMEREVLAEKMLAMVSSRLLSDEEVINLAEKNGDISKRLQEIEEFSGFAAWVEVDADNDGIEDVFLQQFLGGSAGFTYYYLFKGSEEGNYTETYGWENFREEFAFIEWEGKNYYARTTFDYSQKAYDGIGLIAFKDGVICDEVELKIVKADEGNTYTTNIVLGEEGFEELAESIVHSFDVSSVDFTMNNAQPVGSAETVEEQNDGSDSWYSDYDNDGIVEKYDKSIFYTTNMYTASNVSLLAEDENDKTRFYNLLSEDGENTVQIWVDKTNYGNVIYLVNVASLYDFRVKAYFMNSDSMRLLFQIDYEFDLSVEER